jgi:hypothetical protein
MHGNDIIFDRTSQLLGFVPADCSNISLIDKKIIVQQNVKINEKIDEKNNKVKVELIQGSNTKSNDSSQDFKFVNIIILLSSVTIIIIFIVIIGSTFMMNTKEASSYENISDEADENKIPPKIEDVTQNNGTAVTSEEVEYLRKMMRLSNI